MRRGVRRQMIESAINSAAQRGGALVQLTTDHLRADARLFYESLGLTNIHHGKRLNL